MRAERRKVRPAVLWFTGLPGSGKTTLARGVSAHLRRRGLPVEELDGDGIRALFPDTGFSRQDRDLHLRRVGHLAGTLEKHGVFVVASFVSPFADTRRSVRLLCSKFIEIHVTAPLEVCERRDPKGLYARARRGELKDFTGVDSPYEAPESPELAVDTARLTPAEALAEVLAYVDERLLSGSA